LLRRRGEYRTIEQGILNDEGLGLRDNIVAVSFRQFEIFNVQRSMLNVQEKGRTKMSRIGEDY
jgi:hypothetical protein